MRRILPTVLATTLLLLLTTSGPARAQEGFFAPVREAALTVWDFVTSPFQRGSIYAVTPPTQLMAKGATDGFDFWESLEDAGYVMKEFTTGIGIIPDLKVEFVLARELTDADRDWLELKIEIDATRRRGLTAVIQREILRTLLAASNLEEYRIAKLDLTLLPLPAAVFVMEPKEWHERHLRYEK